MTLVFAMFSLLSVAQRNPASQRFNGVWEMKGVRQTATGDLIIATPAGGYKAFLGNGRFTNFNIAKTGSVATIEGRFTITSDSTYEERIEAAANSALKNTTTRLTYSFVNNNNFYVRFQIGTEEKQWFEEHWRRITLAEDDAISLSTTEAVDFQKDLSYFTSSLAIALKKGVKKTDIEKITNPQLKEVAILMLNNQYNTKYRAETYKAILKPETLGQQLMIGDGYSKYENITGIYLPKGQQLILVEGVAPGKSLNLLVPNWNRRAPEGIDPTKDPAGWGIVRKTFPLKNGINIINLTDFDGLAYVDYFSEKPETEKPIKIHFEMQK